MPEGSLGMHTYQDRPSSQASLMTVQGNHWSVSCVIWTIGDCEHDLAGRYCRCSGHRGVDRSLLDAHFPSPFRISTTIYWSCSLVVMSTLSENKKILRLCFLPLFASFVTLEDYQVGFFAAYHQHAILNPHPGYSCSFVLRS